MTPGIVAAAAASAAVSIFVVGVIRLHAGRFGLLDQPNSRSSHRTPTPRGGGVGIVLGTGAGLLIASLAGGSLSGAAAIIFLAATSVAAIGLIDDLGHVNPAVRLVIQILAAVAVVAVTGPLSRLPLPPPLAFSIPPVLGWLLSCLWIAAVTNFFNFMDGVDGLAGGQAVATCIGIVVAGWGTEPSVLALCAGAACSGFLTYNWPPARVFMGDVGSGFLGFILAALPFLVPPTLRPNVLLAVAVGMSLFLLDPVVTLAKRAWARKPLMQAHREHVYQQLAEPGEPVTAVTSAYIAAALVLALLGAVSHWHPLFAWVGILVGGAAFLVILKVSHQRSRVAPSSCAANVK